MIQRTRNHFRLTAEKATEELSPEMMEFINQKLEEDDELTASRLKNMLPERWPELRGGAGR